MSLGRTLIVDYHVLPAKDGKLIRNTQAILRSREQRKISGNVLKLELLSPKRLDYLIRTIISVLAVALLLLPVLILYRIQPLTPAEIKTQGQLQILTIFVFTLVFSAAVAITTRAKRQEVFAATAAYCAVLVVFLGNTSNVLASGAH